MSEGKRKCYAVPHLDGWVLRFEDDDNLPKHPASRKDDHEDVKPDTCSFRCGTIEGMILEEIRDDYLAGHPVANPDYTIREVIADVPEVWENRAVIFSIDGTDEEYSLPIIMAEGEMVDYYLRDQWEDFHPEEGHRYRIRLRRYSNGYSSTYDYLGTISDEKVL